MALVLGGGGARGFAHLGVLKVLEREGIPVDLLVGCSAGALVGSLYAFAGSSEAAEEALLAYTSSPDFQDGRYRDIQTIAPLEKPKEEGFFRRLKRAYKTAAFFASTLLRESYVKPEEFAANVAGILPDRNIEDSPIPLCIVAADLQTGDEVLLREGPLRLAVQASSAIAGVFPPVRWGGRDLVDGGFVDKVPVEAALRLGADVVIAVDVSLDVAFDGNLDRRGTTLTTRASAILSEALTQAQVRFADVVIRPDIRKVHWADFRSVPQAVPLGEEAARAALPAIRAALRRGWPRRLLRLLGRHPRRIVVFRPYPPEEKTSAPSPPPPPDPVPPSSEPAPPRREG
ncbi:MAG: patatin-like phospholipase family protein [Acidobacteriota bacterium]